jgi:signal transduction histidine kinase
MFSILRRGLFWRVYLTLVASLVVVALLSAGLWQILMHPLMMHSGMRMTGAARRSGPHLGMLLTLAAAVGLAAYPIVARITGRLERLRASLDHWGQGQLASRAAVEGGDEVAAVAASFNAAADRVETLLAAHRDLLAHASHELRSPLARLRMAVEMFAETGDPSLRPSIVQDIAELSAIVDEILLASRLDQAASLETRERVDCLGLVAEEVARTGASLRQVGADGASFDVEGSPRLLRRMFRNLIENAAKHGAPPVEVALDRDAGSGAILVSIDDHGPGIPEAEWARVFEPFYRPSGRAEADGGWGLGLSIVRQIAARHGGAVSCLARPGGGGRFLVTLPAAPETSKV